MIRLSELLDLLNKNYLYQYRTRLVGGFNEPFYRTFQKGQQAEIQFSHDYIRSALHELSHWCVAGIERRKLDDFGYWYAADGRNQQQQDEFFKVEIKPQTIEWAFSMVSGVDFEASVDNLQNQVGGAKQFEQNLHKQMLQYLGDSFPKRVKEILLIIASYRGIDVPCQYISLKLSQKI
ncbi:MAG: elongation factor P hydroxylase [Alcanivoracaceae bacterium]|nr:elongation factor P hydroxylase [Alcanivoracaceae bacterium]